VGDDDTLLATLRALPSPTRRYSAITRRSSGGHPSCCDDDIDVVRAKVCVDRHCDVPGAGGKSTVWGVTDQNVVPDITYYGDYTTVVMITPGILPTYDYLELPTAT